MHDCVIRRLDNGLPVLIKPVANKVVTVDMWVNTGSANESQSRNGISHFLEHMLFKGTPKYGPGELDKVIMSVGGVWNAGTSKDFTHYYVTVASPYFDTALDCISDMIKNALIDQVEFDQEKNVILEEYRRKQDSPVGLLYDELYDAAYETGPYKNSVLGSFESISALNRDDMFGYYESYYTADNMALVIAGEVDPDQCLDSISKAFHDLRRSAVPATDAPRTTTLAASGVRRLGRDVNETYIGMAFNAPALDDARAVLAMDLAVTILGDGRSSRLFQIVKERKRLVNSVSAGFATHRYPGMVYVIATPAADVDTQQVMDEIGIQMRELGTAPPTESEMAKARRVIRNGLLFGMETNTGQTSTIGYYYTLTGGTEFLNQYLARLDALSSDDVAQIAKDYFAREPVNVIVEPTPPTGNESDL